jgi:hypothetical protein
MSSATPPPVVSMLAWWDPKSQNSIQPDSIVPGVLFWAGAPFPRHARYDSI